MSGQDGGKPTPEPDNETEPERTHIVIGPGKPGGDYRFRMTASRSGKIDLKPATGNYENQDAFFSMSIGFDDPEGLDNLAVLVEGDASLTSERIANLIYALQGRVEVEYLTLEGNIRARYGLGPTPDRRVGAKADDPGQGGNGTREFLADDPDGPATKEQVNIVMKITRTRKNTWGVVKAFTDRLGKGLVKDLTYGEAADLIITLDAQGKPFRKTGGK